MELYCNGNKLESLDISNNSRLTKLNCLGNPLPGIDISMNSNLLCLVINKSVEIKGASNGKLTVSSDSDDLNYWTSF